MLDELDIQLLEKKLVELARKFSKRASKEESGRGNVYTIVTAEAEFEATIGPSWIGYELRIPKNVLGRAVSIFEDTDNYSVGDEGEPQATEIFYEGLNILRSLLSKKILIGKDGRKILIAIPTDSSYALHEKGRFISKEREVSVNDDRISQLRALK